MLKFQHIEEGVRSQESEVRRKKEGREEESFLLLLLLIRRTGYKLLSENNGKNGQHLADS
ncbi:MULTISPECIES: hypothetical protein [unclassified Okeania]|uniref:hypothetical protein n=1 Tax=unclassified Okeania TaxID=2634635 RepID=UPI0013BD7647|nr:MULTISPECIES: hypothetical protein [unclassified Okeania]NES76730.1 hypothetical protein [Okeania sp. SIO1H4]NET20656.1 hypothetical protein [Okeania sp. SIO1H5]NET93874.1 hypothetical protein [Okeania sp. SIO1H2]